MNRRHFLQFSASTLAALGLSQWDILKQGDRYARTLAQSTPRKLALLVGINDYPDSSQYASLQGCVTDVELQRQLLIHRFGFQPSDIVTLTDAKATRQGILTAFEQHLIRQAKPGDVVVFHFSGHGSQVSDPDKDHSDGLNSTFVPVDGVLPPNYPNQGGAVKDIMGHTLFLLMSALQTEHVTVVLDSCHSGGGTRGSLQVRSRAGGSSLQPDPAELEYQRQWLPRLRLSPAEFIRQRRAGVAKGVVIASAGRDQLAADAPFSDFYAGAFTYLMTQYLWQQTGTAIVSSTIPNIARATTKASSSQQEPQLEVQPNSGHDRQPLYFIAQQTLPAEAVITQLNGEEAVLWLGGIAPQNLAAFGQSALLTTMGTQGVSRGQVRLESRKGLVGRGKLLSGAKPGALLQEQVRAIPTNLTLKLGLAPSLGQETDAAQTALKAINRIESLSLQQGEVDYILGRMTAAYRSLGRSTPSSPPVDSVGLFHPGLDPVPGSFGAAGEAATAAVTRLQAKLKSLLAARIVRLTLNTNASRLKVAVTMTPAGQATRTLASSFTSRGQSRSTSPLASSIATVPIGTAIEFQIVNNEARDLYFSVLVIDAVGEMSVIFPNQWLASADTMKVAAGQTLRIPQPSDRFTLVTQEPKGPAEALIIASSAPLGNALKSLQAVAARGGQSRGPVTLGDEPTDVISSLLDDIGDKALRTINPGMRAIDTTQFAALSVMFEVI
jgi:Caspase domain/Domain of unknown function (DUF4384)